MQNELKHHLRVEPYPYQREGIIYGLRPLQNGVCLSF